MGWDLILCPPRVQRAAWVPAIKRKGASVNSLYWWSAHIHHKWTQKKKLSVQKSEDQITALLLIGALINCSPASLTASSQILFISTATAELCAASKKKEERKKKRKKRVKSFPQGASQSIFKQDPARMLRFFMEKGWKSIKFWEHFMASMHMRDVCEEMRSSGTLMTV